MLQDEQYIIDKLGIQDWPDDKKRETIVEATMRAGEAIMDGLSDEQDQEYTAIINDDHEVIDRWLEQNVPDYQENPAYKAITETVDEDPEHNNPAKLFATIAWFQVNVPDAQQRVEKVFTTYKQELGLS